MGCFVGSVVSFPPNHQNMFVQHFHKIRKSNADVSKTLVISQFCFHCKKTGNWVEIGQCWVPIKFSKGKLIFSNSFPSQTGLGPLFGLEKDLRKMTMRVIKSVFL